MQEAVIPYGRRADGLRPEFLVFNCVNTSSQCVLYAAVLGEFSKAEQRFSEPDPVWTFTDERFFLLGIYDDCNAPINHARVSSILVAGLIASHQRISRIGREHFPTIPGL